MSSTHVFPKNRTVNIERTMHIIECANCSIDFGIGADFMAKRRKDHGTFYCPNGHSNYYSGPSDLEKKARDLEEQKTRLANQLQWAREDRDDQRTRRLTAERQRAAARGQVTKIKNRVAAGVCPCCNRTFANVARHMAGQHPDYAGDQ